MKYFVSALIGFWAVNAYALVDMKNANFSDSWVDFIVPGSGYDLRVQRTYNSRTLFNGMFGFGWCSDFETTLEVTAEGNVKITECGAGLEVVYKPKGFNEKEIGQTITKIVAEVKKRNPSLTKKYLDGLKEELKSRIFFREELTRQLGIKGEVTDNQTYYANGRSDEKIILQKGVYTRSLSDNTFQKFNSKGQLIALYDRNGNHLKLTHKGDLLVKVTDNNGRSLDFQYYPNIKKVKLVSGPGGLKSSYEYKGEDLIAASNSSKETFHYGYDDLHNMITVKFPDKSTKEITYNKDKDWVTSFKDRQGCMEKYNYDENPKDPLNHFWSLVEKRCGNTVTNRSRYEFWHKFTKQGKRYLHRAFSEINGKITDIVYHEEFGKPISITRDKNRVRYTYYDSGLIRKKIEPIRATEFYYKGSCEKVSHVTTQYYGFVQAKGKKSPTKKLIKSVKTQFSYDKPKCNLVAAKNSDGQIVALKYDSRGRIAKITDQSRKVVLIKYEERFGKPAIVTRPGLGTIRVKYKGDGSIDKVDSKEGPSVAAQVASVFNNLLEIISPATSELAI